MFRSILCDYNNTYILVKVTITVVQATSAEPNNANKKVIFKNCAPFTSCISRINNTQVDDAQYIDGVMPMHNLLEYSNNYSKTFELLWQDCIGDWLQMLLILKLLILLQIKLLLIHLTGKTGNNGTKNVELMVPLHLSNFWRTAEMVLINCEINLDLNWSDKCVIVVNNPNEDTTFSITDAKLYVPFVTLLNQNNAKLLKQSKSGFKRTTNCNKYQPKVSTEDQINI